MIMRRQRIMHVGSCMIIWRDKAALSGHKLNRCPLLFSMPPTHPSTPTHRDPKKRPYRSALARALFKPSRTLSFFLFLVRCALLFLSSLAILSSFLRSFLRFFKNSNQSKLLYNYVLLISVQKFKNSYNSCIAIFY